MVQASCSVQRELSWIKGSSVITPPFGAQGPLASSPAYSRVRGVLHATFRYSASPSQHTALSIFWVPLMSSADDSLGQREARFHLWVITEAF